MTTKPSVRIASAASILLFAATAYAQGIQWAPAADEALAQARSKNKVVMFAIHMEGDRANDRMIRNDYQDSNIGKLSGNLVCVFCSAWTGRPAKEKDGLHGEANRTNAELVRELYLKTGEGDWIKAPQHVFVGPDGKVLTSIATEITKGELEWLMADAIRKISPGFKWELSGAARAPKDLVAGKADGGKGHVPPPTSKQIKAALKKLDGLNDRRRGRGRNFRKSLDTADLLIRSDRHDAIRWTRTALRLRGVGGPLMKRIGEQSPEAWWKLAAEHLGDNNNGMRKAAVIALERIRAPKSFSALRIAFRKEEQVDIEGRLLRAMAAVAPIHRSSITAVAKTLDSHKSELVRAHAAVAAGLLEDRAAITENLRKALQDKTSLVRSVAAYVIAIRQDREMLQHLEFSKGAEPDADTKAWMEKAIQAVKTGDTKPFRRFLEKTLDNNRVAKEARNQRRRRNRGEDEKGKEGGSGRGRGGRGRRGKNRKKGGEKRKGKAGGERKKG